MLLQHHSNWLSALQEVLVFARFLQETCSVLRQSCLEELWRGKSSRPSYSGTRNCVECIHPHWSDIHCSTHKMCSTVLPASSWMISMYQTKNLVGRNRQQLFLQSISPVKRSVRSFYVFSKSMDFVIWLFNSDCLLAHSSWIFSWVTAISDATFSYSSSSYSSISMHKSSSRSTALDQFLSAWCIRHSHLCILSVCSPSQTLSEEQSKFIKEIHEKVFTMLQETPPDGKSFAQTILVCNLPQPSAFDSFPGFRDLVYLPFDSIFLTEKRTGISGRMMAAPAMCGLLQKKTRRPRLKSSTKPSESFSEASHSCNPLPWVISTNGFVFLPGTRRGAWERTWRPQEASWSSWVTQSWPACGTSALTTWKPADWSHAISCPPWMSTSKRP